jgi:hypothetical protein
MSTNRDSTPRRISAIMIALLAPLALFCSASIVRAQGTAFTYQGRLDDGGSPASGLYDLSFSLYDAPSEGIQQGNPLIQFATAISNGLFTVVLDFGPQFPGAGRWLELGVRTNGGEAFTTLTRASLSRPPLTPSRPAA